MRHITVDRILQKHLNFRISRRSYCCKIYVLKTDNFFTHFAFTLFQYLKMAKYLQQKLYSVLKPYSTHRKMSIDVIWEFEGVTMLKNELNIRESTVECLLCFVQIINIRPFFISWTYYGWHCVCSQTCWINSSPLFWKKRVLRPWCSSKI
jgi:hypothetical protein